MTNITTLPWTPTNPKDCIREGAVVEAYINLGKTNECRFTLDEYHLHLTVYHWTDGEQDYTFNRHDLTPVDIDGGTKPYTDYITELYLPDTHRMNIGEHM